MLVWLLLGTAAVLIAADIVARRFGPEDAVDHVILTGTLASAWCVILVGLVGTAGLLGPVVLAAAAIASAGLARAFVSVPPQQRRAVRSVASDIAGSARREPWVASLVAVAVAALAWQVVVALVLPSFAFDGISYHLTIVSDWVQGGDLTRSDLSLCCASYPLGPDLLFAWVVALDGGTGLVDLVQAPHVVLAAAAVVGLARSGGLPVPGSIAAGAIFASTPIVLVQAPTNMVDVIVVAWTLAALHWLTRYSVTGDRRRLLLVGVAVGLVLGTKGTGVIWAGAILAVAALCVFARSRRADGGRLGVVAPLMLLAVVAGLIGGPWYVRNWIVDGNPLHPFEVTLLGNAIFDGPLEVDGVLTAAPGGPDEPEIESVVRSWASDLTFWEQGSYDYQQRTGGLGPLFAWFGLASGAVGVVVSVRRRSPLLWAGAATTIVFAVQPYRWWSRFTIPLAAFAAIAVVASSGVLPAPAKRLVRVAIVALVVAGIGLSSYEVDPAARAAPIASVDVLSLIGSPGPDRDLSTLFHPEYRFLREVPPLADIAVDLDAGPVRFVSPLFGQRLGRAVVKLQAGHPPPVWIVTSEDRPVDRLLRAAASHVLVADDGGIRVWRPA